MNYKVYKKFRIGVALFIGVTVSIAVSRNSTLLAFAAIVTGLLFILLIRSKVKITIDERERSVREKAAQLTYAIITPTMGISSVVITFFAQGKYVYLESVGMVVSYLTLFILSTYALSYHFLNRKFGGNSDEE